MEGFELALSGGHPNSLGNTEEVVEHVLKEKEKFEELFNCYFSDDEVVRLRTSSAIKRVCLSNKTIVLPYLDRLLEEISQIDQASTKWTLALLFDYLRDDMTAVQRERAEGIMKVNLETDSDWIVLNNTMATLTKWSKKNELLQNWLLPHLERLAKDPRKSVRGRANKFLKELSLAQ